MADYYAWAPIHHKFEDGKPTIIQPGKKVNKDMFDEGDWNYFTTEGIVRDTPFPKDIRQGESVRSHLIRKANEARENAEVPYREIMAKIGMNEAELPPSTRLRQGEDPLPEGAVEGGAVFDTETHSGSQTSS